MNKTKSFRDQAPEELIAAHRDLCKELFTLRNQKRFAGNKLDRPHEIKAIKRDIARVLTLLKEKELMKESIS